MDENGIPISPLTPEPVMAPEPAAPVMAPEQFAPAMAPEPAAPIPLQPFAAAPDQAQAAFGQPQFGQDGTTPPPPQYQMPPQQQYTQTQYSAKMRSHGIGSLQKQKWPAVLLAFCLGWIGMHKFYLGYKNEGTVMLIVGAAGMLLTLGLGTMVMFAIGIIEAVKYLTLTEEDFEYIYLRGYKGWF